MVGTAIGLCVVNICAFGLTRIFELICTCLPQKFASRRNVKYCSVHLKKRRPIFSFVSDEDRIMCGYMATDCFVSGE